MSTKLRVGLVVAEVRRGLREHDPLLAAAGLTAYLALGAVPLLALAGRISTWLVGGGEVRATGQAAARYLPSHLDLAQAAQTLASGAAQLSWGAAIAAIVVASLLSERIVRTLARFSPASTRRRLALRGRVCTVVLVAVVTVGVLFLVLAGRPLLLHDFGNGTGSRLFGIWLAFVVGWFPGSALLTVVYRFFAPAPLRWGSAAVGATVAASWLTGQSLGYVLVLRFVGRGIGSAYGGSAVAGTVAAMLFLIYLQAVVFVLGCLLAVAIEATRNRPCASSA